MRRGLNHLGIEKAGIRTVAHVVMKANQRRVVPALLVLRCLRARIGVLALESGGLREQERREGAQDEHLARRSSSARPLPSPRRAAESSSVPPSIALWQFAKSSMSVVRRGRRTSVAMARGVLIARRTSARPGSERHDLTVPEPNSDVASKLLADMGEEPADPVQSLRVAQHPPRRSRVHAVEPTGKHTGAAEGRPP